KPKKDDIFGFLKEIARTALKISLTILAAALFYKFIAPFSGLVQAIIIGLVDFYIYKMFEHVMPIFLDSIEVPYEGEGGYESAI
ncbi:MAG: hypothetical protein ACXABG_13020, partial [Promethearchaeota archaeon]